MRGARLCLRGVPRRVVVDASLGSSIGNAQLTLDARVNQLVDTRAGQLVPVSGFGDVGYQGSGSAPDGANGVTGPFRNLAVVAEISEATVGAPADVTLLDNVAPGRRAHPERARRPGVSACGRPDPCQRRCPGRTRWLSASACRARRDRAGRAGDWQLERVAGRGHTIVMITVTGLDRPWLPGGATPPACRPVSHRRGPDRCSTVRPSCRGADDFWLSTFDGRSWSPVAGRGPTLPTGPRGRRGAVTRVADVPDSTTAGPATDLRHRTTQSLASQGNADQTMVIPLTVGATASALGGHDRSAAGAPGVPPSLGAEWPVRAASPSGRSAPTRGPPADGSGGSGTGGGGSRTPRTRNGAPVARLREARRLTGRASNHRLRERVCGQANARPAHRTGALRCRRECRSRGRNRARRSPSRTTDHPVKSAEDAAAHRQAVAAEG